MATPTRQFWRLSILSSTLLFFTVTIAAASTTTKPTKLVSDVCNRTSNYTFCVSALYDDPRTPTTDAYGLAFVAFGMAYLNASATQGLITKLQKKSANETRQFRLLETCRLDYKKAISALEMAYGDLNSETFFELAELAGNASAAAKHCQAAFKDAPHRPLTARNLGLRGLCEICVVVSKLFTGGF